MSQDNMAITRAHLDAWNARDTDAVRALYDPNIVVLTTEDWPESGPWVGRDAAIHSLEGDVYYCFWLRHGRFLRVEDHLTLRGALAALGLEGDSLEAAGLSQQDAHSDP